LYNLNHDTDFSYLVSISIYEGYSSGIGFRK